MDTIAPDGRGTKAAAHYRYDVPAGGSVEIRLRLTDKSPGAMPPAGPFDMCDATLALRLREADEFYATVIPDHLSVEGKRVMRQAFAGLLWSKQFYHYIVKEWLDGDPASPPPPRDRLEGRNSDWLQLYNADVISMPDKWEYPWYATWDLGFHCVAIALIDPEFAKSQLTLFLREWYMHPSGQLPAYEWALDDVNPPLHAWAVLRVYQIERRRTGKGDRLFLERAFHKLLLNFTWWVNRKDAEGNNVFQGGFLGLDNIGVFDRSKPLPTGGILEQSDGTSWMAAYSITMLAIAFELANENPAYEDVASKFWEHFLYIANAMSSDGGRGIDLWDEDDGFFYDVLHVDGLRHAVEGPIAGGPHPAHRERDARAEAARADAGIQAAARMVRREPARSDRACRVDDRNRPERAAAALDRRPGPAPPDPAGDARPGRVPVGPRHPGAVTAPHGPIRTV